MLEQHQYLAAAGRQPFHPAAARRQFGRFRRQIQMGKQRFVLRTQVESLDPGAGPRRATTAMRRRGRVR